MAVQKKLRVKGSKQAGKPKPKPRRIASATQKQRDLLASLREQGSRIYGEIEQGQFPKFMMPSRSVGNIVFDEKTRQYILGIASTLRSSGNAAQLRSFTQLVWLAFFANRLTEQKKSSTLRDVYYASQAFAVEFDNQGESDNIIVDLESILSYPRETFQIFPDDRNKIFGDLDIEYTSPGYAGRKLNLSSHPDGYFIGPSLTTSELQGTNAEVVIAIEKTGLFTRFVEEQVDKKHKALIINTNGQASRSARTLLKRLHDELGLPVLIFTDADVYGEHIAKVIQSGSANAAHLREMTVPDAKWMGVWATDITKYNLPTIPMTENDIRRCQSLKKDPRYKKGHWRAELDEFMRIKKKAELEAFSKFGLTYITDKYLPERLELAKSF